MRHTTSSGQEVMIVDGEKRRGIGSEGGSQDERRGREEFYTVEKKGKERKKGRKRYLHP